MLCAKYDFSLVKQNKMIKKYATPNFVEIAYLEYYIPKFFITQKVFCFRKFHTLFRRP